MASKDRAQRIGIWIIAIVMTVGTIGSFVVIILQNDNNKIDQAEQQKTDAAKLASDQQQQTAAQAFNASDVTALKTEVIKEGTGDIIKATDSINASYFGWTSDGKIFDSTKKKDNTSDSPITFALNRIITGWAEGLTGLKVGSVVRLIIPADKAYGATVSGIIPANAPLEFIVEIHKIDNSQASAQ
jgi:FKBP-type peptidyl-prolyl cis-trans isomerase FkpA